MRSKIRSDRGSCKVLEFWRHLNKSLVQLPYLIQLTCAGKDFEAVLDRYLKESCIYIPNDLAAGIPIYIYTFHTYIQYTVYSEGSFSAALIWPVKSTHDLTKSSTVSWSPRVHAFRCLLDQRKTGVADGQRNQRVARFTCRKQPAPARPSLGGQGKRMTHTTETLIWSGWETLIVPVFQSETSGRNKMGGPFVPGLATGTKGAASATWLAHPFVLVGGWCYQPGQNVFFFSIFLFSILFLFQLYFCISIKFMYCNSVCMISTNIYIVTYIIFVLDTFHI